jgi:LacI family transcriptional regulator
VKREKVTLKALSERLDYSVSTISKALNDSPEISDEAKKQILEVAREMGYRSPSIVKDTKTIAAVLPDVRNDFFAQVLNGIENEASANNYNILTCITNESHDKEVRYLIDLSAKGIDGFIVAAAEETQQKGDFEHFDKLLINDVPLVMFDRVIDEVACDKIINDDMLSGAKAVDALMNSGDRNLCMVSTISGISVGKLREQGIRQRLSNYPDAIFSVIRTTDLDEFKTRLIDSLRYDHVQSIIALDQIAGILALNTAHELGINVPDQLQIICYSNGILSQFSYPQMSVMDQHAGELGKKTFVRIHNLLNNKDEIKVTRIHTLQSSLLHRGTTRD